MGIAGGVLLGLSFEPTGWWPLTVPALALMLGAISSTGARRGAIIGGLSATAYFLVLLQWLDVIGPDAWIGLAVTCALYAAAASAVIGLAKFERLATPFLVAAVWAASEAIRARFPFGGFTWGQVAMASADVPTAHWSAYGGLPLVGFLLVAAAGLLVYAFKRLRQGPTRRGVLVALAVAVAIVVVPVPLPDLQPTGQVSAAIVQGNVPRLGLDFLGQSRQVLRNHVEATAELADEVAAGRAVQPELVLWPENSTDLDPFIDPQTRRLIDSAAADIDAPILVGAVVGTEDPTLVANTSIVWDPEEGPGPRYVKRHPVPFGEYVPFRSLLEGVITRFDRVPRDFISGTEVGVLPIGPAEAAVVICFEIADGPLVAEHVAAGGDFITVQTNNATYGRTGQPEQQLQITRLRAMEHGRTTAVAATSGISAVIGPDGKVRQATTEFTRATLTADLEQVTELTLGTRLGRSVEWVLLFAGLVAAGMLVIGARRRAVTVEEAA
jgi:apolipoprotein N-acyltransferase